MLNKILFWVILIAIIGGSGYFIWRNFFDDKNDKVFCTLEAKLCPDGSYVGRTGPNYEFQQCPSERTETADTKAVRQVAENFAGKMQSVSLLGSRTMAISSINENYGDLASPQLISQWVSDPTKAPGRLFSSPWPDRIEILRISSLAANQYEVKGNILYITSVEKTQGGSAGSQPITLTIGKNADDKWLITEAVLGTFNPNDVWKSFTDTEQGVKFEYPAKLTTVYAATHEWPPKVTISNDTLSCSNQGEIGDNNLPIDSVQKIISGQFYCIETQTGAAAGSAYKSYNYKTIKDDRLVLIKFALRYPQCGNYNEPYKSDCEKEYANFNVDTIVTKITRSIQFIQKTPADTGTGTSTVVTNSGIKGTALLGPVCPVMKNPPEPECADKPYSTSLVVTTADQSKVIKQFSSDANGKFSVNIPAGEYYIRSAAAANILPYCSSGSTIKVTANQYTDTIVYCDTGIR